MKRMILVMAVLVCVACAPRFRTPDVDVARQEQLEEEARRKAQAEQRRAREKQELEQVVAQADAMFKTMLRAIDEDDYDSFISVCNASMRSMYRDRDMFVRENNRRREIYGLTGARPVVRAQKKNPYYIVLYQVKFSKLAEPVPVTLYLKKDEDTGELQVALIQYGFSRVVRQPAEPHNE